MKSTLMSGAAVLLLLAVPAAAQNDNSKTLDPNKLTVEMKKPKLDLNDQQKTAIQNALVEAHTQQKTSKDFKPQVGMELPTTMKVDVMPEDLIRAQPPLKEYGYAKTATDILVLDPMNKKIIAVLPRKFPVDAKANAKSGTDWADTKGKQMTGQAPQGANKDHFPEPAGDAGDTSNGNEKNAMQKEQGQGQPKEQGQK